jgi:hypothetical protein
MRKLILILIFGFITTSKSYAEIIYLKCDNSNIQISERINRDDLILFKKLQYLSFNDTSVTKMKTLEGNDAFIFFDWSPSGQSFGDKRQVINLSNSVIAFSTNPVSVSNGGMIELMFIFRQNGILTSFPTDSKINERSICSKISKRDLPTKNTKTKF